MKSIIIASVLSFYLFSPLAVAGEFSISDKDTIASVLTSHKDKRVTVVLKSGKELTGKVSGINKDVVQIAQLSGMEYFDAVISLKKVSAVIFRTKK